MLTTLHADMHGCFLLGVWARQVVKYNKGRLKLFCVCVCVCVCVSVLLYILFMRTQMCIMTWVLLQCYEETSCMCVCVCVCVCGIHTMVFKKNVMFGVMERK